MGEETTHDEVGTGKKHDRSPLVEVYISVGICESWPPMLVPYGEQELRVGQNQANRSFSDSFSFLFAI